MQGKDPMLLVNNLVLVTMLYGLDSYRIFVLHIDLYKEKCLDWLIHQQVREEEMMTLPMSMEEMPV